MWVAKFKLRDTEEDDLFCSLCVKHNILIHAYPLSKFERDKKIHLIASVVLSGKEENKKALVKSLKKDKRVVSYEQHKDFLLSNPYLQLEHLLKVFHSLHWLYCHTFLKTKYILFCKDFLTLAFLLLFFILLFLILSFYVLCFMLDKYSLVNLFLDIISRNYPTCIQIISSTLPKFFSGMPLCILKLCKLFFLAYINPRFSHIPNISNCSGLYLSKKLIGTPIIPL